MYMPEKERARKRAERFGTYNEELEEERKAKRAERFGVEDPESKLAARAARFGLPTTPAAAATNGAGKDKGGGKKGKAAGKAAGSTTEFEAAMKVRTRHDRPCLSVLSYLPAFWRRVRKQ
jgi:hypothetical protein